MGTDDALILGERSFTSRLLLGTGKFADVTAMLEAVRRSGTTLVTAAIRRFNREQQTDDLLAPLSRLPDVVVMPNTSGAINAREAVLAARIGRELTGHGLVKLEIHPNPHHLMPDPIETFAAARELVADGFTVLPYMPADPVLAKRLEDVGCAAVMPLGAAIGSGQGLATVHLLRLIIENSNVPVIVDAGLRSPSDAAAAMEMGCDAVLVNSAVAAAGDPGAMAQAFAEAVCAGRRAFHAGLMGCAETAVATSPLTAFLDHDAEP